MTKVRVYELAKEFGMKGPEMAKVLRRLGFDKIKSHMAVLDPADQMMVVARLEAQGFAHAPVAVAAAPADGVPKKKSLPSADSGKKSLPPPVGGKELPRKKLPADTTGGEELEVEPEPIPEPKKKLTPEPEPTPEPQPAAAAEPAPPPEPAPAPVAQPEPQPVAEAPAPAEPSPQPSAAPVAEPQPAAAAAEPAPSAEATPTEATAPAPTAEATAPAPTAEATAPEATAEATAPAPAAAPAPPVRQVKKLLVPQAKATVVGRIELPQETIRDATRRSAPMSDAAADRKLRRAALQSTQSRTASRASGPRRGPGGMGRPGPGRGGRGGFRGRNKGNTPVSTIDPNKVVEVEPPFKIKNLSEALGIKVTELIRVLAFNLGVRGKTINSFLSQEEVELVAMEMGRAINIVEHKEAEEELISAIVKDAADQTEESRAPVLTFMGHVDHGKTTLLDAMRASDVVKGEAGGITQHIGAYKVTHRSGKSFVILDTPGHAAFTSMRARGASLTDIIVLVVAADDGVMPQTEEAINHAKDAKVPIIVAINKCDRPNANPMQVRQQLSVKGLQPEEWGGNVQMIDVSATTGEGLDDLVEKITLEAELLELRAKPTANGAGVVIESKQTPEQGVVVNVLINNGTLRVKDRVLCGESLSRIRGMTDDHGRQVKQAGPSTPVTIIGIDELPQPGDPIFAISDAKDQKKAKEVAADRQRRARDLSLAERSAVTLESLSDALAAAAASEVKVILKADVMGSLEPIKSVMADLATDEVRVNLIHTALGGITETDVALAEAGGAIIIGFNSMPDQGARIAADRAGVQIKFYDVIYALIDDMKLALEGMLAPDEVEQITGHAEVRAIFRSSKFGNIAGCYVLDGVINRNSRVRVSRNGKVVFHGGLAGLRRIKDDAKEVKAGFECGITLQGYNDIKEGDQIEAYSIELVKRTLS